MAWNNGISFRLPWYPSAKLFSDRLIPTTIHTSLLEGVCCISQIQRFLHINRSTPRIQELDFWKMELSASDSWGATICFTYSYMAIYTRDIHIEKNTHTLWYDLSSPFLFLEHNHSTTSKKRSPCTFYDPILYHLVSTRPAGLWQGSWLWDLWSSCSCAIISV